MTTRTGVFQSVTATNLTATNVSLKNLDSPTGVAAGTYYTPQLVIGTDGRVTSAATGSPTSRIYNSGQGPQQTYLLPSGSTNTLIEGEYVVGGVTSMARLTVLLETAPGGEGDTDTIEIVKNGVPSGVLLVFAGAEVFKQVTAPLALVPGDVVALSRTLGGAASDSFDKRAELYLF